MNNFIFNKLEGSLVELSLFTKNNITQDYISWLNDPNIMQYSNQRFVKHDRITCQNYLLSFKDTDNLFILIRTKKGNKAIGTMTAFCNPHHGVVDFGILIGDITEWGKGYGQDAWNSILAWLLDQENIRKVTAGTLACNIAMRNIIEKSGMKIEGVRNEHEIVKGVPEDVILFAIIKK